MTETELEQYRAMLGVEPGITRDELKKVYLRQSFALIRDGAPQDQRDRLRIACEKLMAHLEAIESPRPLAAAVAEPPTRLAAPVVSSPTAEPEFEPPDHPYDPGSFDSWRVNALAPPLVAGLAILIAKSPLGFFLTGFHIWVHEFGHATVGWMTGHQSLPLPIGWTNIDPEKSKFVYGGILFLFGLLFAAGVNERKIWPMILAVGLALTQAYMTWWLPQRTTDMWIAFAGVGGQFYLSAAMVALFYFQFPEKFRWGGCRYVFLFFGASSFFETYLFWKKVKHGDEGIPYGSMINGEEDGGGDMNILHDGFGWTQHKIIATYNHLADVCVVALFIVYVIFVLRLDRLPGLLLEKWRGESIDLAETPR